MEKARRKEENPPLVAGEGGPLEGEETEDVDDVPENDAVGVVEVEVGPSPRRVTKLRKTGSTQMPFLTG